MLEYSLGVFILLDSSWYDLRSITGLAGTTEIQVNSLTQCNKERKSSCRPELELDAVLGDQNFGQAA